MLYLIEVAEVVIAFCKFSEVLDVKSFGKCGPLIT